MAMNYLGDFPTGKTIYVYFNTFDSNDPSASVTLTGLAVTDIEIYKNGSVTQRSSDSGYTLLDTDGIDFDGITGIHGFSIDTSDNTDAGFFAAGNDYTVIVSSVTVDAATINFVAASFSIDNRGLLRPTTAQRTLDVTATGAAGIDWGNIENKTTANDLSGTDIQLCDTTTTVTNSVGLTATAIDNILDETLTSHVTADSLGVAVKDILADTNELQTDDYPTTIAAIQSDTDNIQTRLPTALINGRMDSDVEAINDDTTAADNLAKSALSIVPGACEGTPTTTVIQTDLAETTDDHYIGRVIIFTSGAAAYQATDITDYTGSTGTVTVTALTTAPAASDTFVII
jgi:hypothetical protein